MVKFFRKTNFSNILNNAFLNTQQKEIYLDLKVQLGEKYYCLTGNAIVDHTHAYGTPILRDRSQRHICVTDIAFQLSINRCIDKCLHLGEARLYNASADGLHLIVPVINT